MKAVLRVTKGTAPEMTLFVDAGHNVVVGRVPPADFTIPDDPLMSSRHFCVRCDAQGCAIEDLNSTNGTLINGEPVTVKQLHDGDRIQCGNTVLQVALEAAPVAVPPIESTPTEVDSRPRAVVPSSSPSVSPSPSPTPPPARSVPIVTASPEAPGDQDVTVVIARELGPERGFVAETAAAICQRFDLTTSLPLAPEDGETPEAFAERLMSADDESLNDAITFIAYALPKRLGVWWATRCVRQVNPDGLPEADEKSVQAAENWVVEPSDANRRAGLEVAQQGDFQTAACWTAASPFWCHGNMAPPESGATVPPADNLAGKTISGAVILAAVAHEPEHAVEKQRRFMSLAMQVATGENTWETDSR